MNSQRRRTLRLVKESLLPTPYVSSEIGANKDADITDEMWELPGPPDGRHLYLVRSDG